MNVSSIKSTITSIPNKTLNGINSIGSHTREICHNACDKFTSSNAISKIKDKTGINKDTLIGTSVLLLALYSGVKLVKGIANKAKES